MSKIASQENGPKAGTDPTLPLLLSGPTGNELEALLDMDELRGCLLLQDQSPKFETEEQYRKFLHLKFSLLSLLQDIRSTLAGRVTGHGHSNCKEQGKDAGLANEKLLSQLALFKRLSSAVNASGAVRLDRKQGWQPRLERLADKYGLEGIEGEMFCCGFVLQAMPTLPSSGRQGPGHFLRMVGMTDFEYENLMDKDRLHIKEGCLLGSSNMGWHGSLPTLASPLFSKEALQMLMFGKDISSTAALTLSTTKMMEVLEEEGFGKEGEGSEKASDPGGAKKPVQGPAVPPASKAKPEPVPPFKSLGLEAQLQGPVGSPASGDEKEEDAMAEDDEDGVQDLLGEAAKGTADLTDVLAELRKFPSRMSATAHPGLSGKKRKAEDDETEQGEAAAKGAASGSGTGDKSDGPYRNNLEYLEDKFQLLALQVQLSRKKSSKHLQEAIGRSGEFAEDYIYSGGTGHRGERRRREMEAKQRMLSARIQKRLEKTRKEGNGWKPRLLALSEKLGLDEFEENVVTLLVGNTVSPILKTLVFETKGAVEVYEGLSVNQVLTVFCETFEEQVTRRVYFYKGAKLVQSGILKMGELQRGYGSDLVSTPVEVDRRTLDFVVGLDTELNELVEGSHLYTPTVSMDKVVLPTEQKDLVLKTISSFEAYAEKRAEVGLEDNISYGAGLVILFCGPSGTGKTMTVNALAQKLQKRVLLVNLPSLGSAQGDMNFKWLFREAKVNDAVLFFDECESVFETREHGTKQVNVLLTEMERHKGIVFLATNRPYDLDEAMHRRITLVVEFHNPDHLLRVDIWKKLLPPKLPLAPGIDFKKIGLKYELTGGFIKNAIISSLLLAIGRDKENPVVTEEDLMEGCKLQLRGALRMKSFDRRIVPKAGIDALVISPELEKRLQEIAHLDKARQILFGQWGFSEQMRERQGISALFHGPPGTGKTMAAECLGFEMGKPLKFVNCGELVNKYVGETGKNIDKVFEEAKVLDAVLVFDEAEGLFGARHSGDGSATARYANVDVGILLHHLERFPGVVILVTNTIDGIDKAFFRRIKFVLKFEEPDAKLRARLWRSMIPDKVPVEGSIDFDRLAQRFEYSGGSISSAVFRAAARAALREGDAMKLRMEDLLLAGDEENEKSGAHSGSHKSMFL